MSLMVIAGEASGDLHGQEILRELKALAPDLRIVGVGGAGMSPYLDLKLADVADLGVVGFVEPLVKLPRLLALRRRILAVAKAEGIRTVLTIDYPGFNFSLGAALKAQDPGLKLHHYVCPQVWAWKKGRIPKMGRLLDVLYCLFDFEPALFEGYPVEARFVGNPLVEVVQPEVDRATFLRETGLAGDRPLVALLPGSRRSELSRLLPAMAELVRRWRMERPEVQWVLPVAPTLPDAEVAALLGDLPVRRVPASRTYAARAHADAALVASGTATLETALLGTPFAIVYRLNPLTYQMARHLVKLPFIGLANIVAGREVAPELVQGEVSPEALGKTLAGLLEGAESRRRREALAGVRAHLGEPGAARRVAARILRPEV
ncbi:MAG TPA: lipid-A-disaccharide synthase [Holophagaceae bacterium]|nr:lipid-A-disaccharide synthase [Holophagaceae bacterium]